MRPTTWMRTTIGRHGTVRLGLSVCLSRHCLSVSRLSSLTGNGRGRFWYREQEGRNRLLANNIVMAVCLALSWRDAAMLQHPGNVPVGGVGGPRVSHVTRQARQELMARLPGEGYSTDRTLVLPKSLLPCLQSLGPVWDKETLEVMTPT